MKIMKKEVKVTKGGGTNISRKVVIPIEMANSCNIQSGDKVTWTLCADEKKGMYLILQKKK